MGCLHSYDALSPYIYVFHLVWKITQFGERKNGFFFISTKQLWIFVKKFKVFDECRK